MTQSRSIWRQVFTNFINSLRNKPEGVLVGKDHFGSEYYEFPHKLRGGRKIRWCVPVDIDNFQQEVPPEWEAWLRHRRQDPPTEEEIQINRLKMMQTIENAKKFEQPKKKITPPTEESIFPKYEEFEEEPGAKLNKKI